MSYHLALDAAGGVYLAGTFQGSGDFDTGSGTTVLTSAGGHDGFVLKLTASGDFAWAVRFGGAQQYGVDFPTGLAVDPNGDVFVCGNFQFAADFGGTTLTGNDYSFFLAKIVQ